MFWGFIFINGCVQFIKIQKSHLIQWLDSSWSVVCKCFIKWVCVLHRIFCLFCVSIFSKKDGHLCKLWRCNHVHVVVIIHQIHIFWLNCSSTFFCETVLFLLYLYIRCINVALVQHLICVDFNWFSFSISFLIFLFYCAFYADSNAQY